MKKLFIAHEPISPAEEMHLQVDHGLDVKDVPSVEEVSDWLYKHTGCILESDYDELALSIIDLFTDTEP